MRRWTEIGKDLLIVILVAALLTLTLLALPERTLTSSPLLSAALKPFAGLFGLDQAELTYTEKALPGLDAAQPLAVSVRNSAGRYTAQYDFETLDSVYEALGSMLGQALESAQLEQTTLQKLYSAIAGISVTFVYPAELPSGVLAEWLGAQAPEAGEAAMLYVLSLQESGAVRLYLCGESCWVGDTALSGDALTQALDSYRPDGSFFALEDGTGRYDRVDPRSLIGGETPRLYGATSANPCDARTITPLAAELGFNPYGDASYTDAEGNSFFSETGASLRITADGRLLLSVEEPLLRFTAASAEASAVIETARALLAQLTDGLTGSARLYLTELAETEEETVCTFDYVLDGVPVMQKNGAHAAVVRFTGGALTELELLLRSYTPGTQPISLMPAAQAAAIVPEGSWLRILYDDPGGGQLNAGWKKS